MMYLHVINKVTELKWGKEATHHTLDHLKKYNVSGWWLSISNWSCSWWLSISNWSCSWCVVHLGFSTMTTRLQLCISWTICGSVVRVPDLYSGGISTGRDVQHFFSGMPALCGGFVIVINVNLRLVCDAWLFLLVTVLRKSKSH